MSLWGDIGNSVGNFVNTNVVQPIQNFGNNTVGGDVGHAISGYGTVVGGVLSGGATIGAGKKPDTPAAPMPQAPGYVGQQNPYASTNPNAQAPINTAPQQNYNYSTGQYDPSSASSYPTYPNDAGVGSQAPFSGSTQTPTTPMAGSSSNPGYLAQSINVQVPDTSSRGFNPWSLTGESNARSGTPNHS